MNDRVRHRSLLWLVVFLGLSPRLYSEDSPSPKTVTLTESEQLALTNHPNVKLANEELTVTKAKKDEAARALYPSVNLKAEQTNGMAIRELGTPDFVEKSYGVQVNQPLLQGGKLFYTYEQTKANYESSKAKKDKTERDVLYNVREAYWQMVRSAKAQEVYERAMADLEKERKSAERLLDKDVITKETYLMIASNYHQATLAVESSKAEREAQLWKWTIALGLQRPPDYEPAPVVSINQSTVSLDNCLQLAKIYNPDLRIQKNTMDASLYGYKSNKGSYWPKLSVNGFYGKSGGAYANEEFKYGEDYLIGFQVNQYFAMNTLNFSGFHQRTSPKIGQSTRTEAKTGTATLGLLDAYKTRSDIKDSAYSFHQAETQLQQSELEILADVRDAFANWKKGLTQLSFAQNEVEWKQVEYNVTRIKAAHRDLPLSERAKLRNELAFAEAALVAAQTNYNVLQAALSKVVGVPDLFAQKK